MNLRSTFKAAAVARGQSLSRVPLRGPRPARSEARRPTSRLSRWLVRQERRLNRTLGNHIYPAIPGLRLIYGALLKRWLTVSEAEVPVAGLPAAFDGTTVLLVSDVHTGPFLTPTALRRVFHSLQALRPDLILLGGDLVTGRVEEFEPYHDLFAALQAPLGVFAVLGNHDHYPGDPERLRRSVEAAGIPVLHNRSVVLQRGGARVVLAGIDDLVCGEPDLEGALNGHRDNGFRPPSILLSHNPDVFFKAAAQGVALVLSGHTHGGQVRLPGLPLLVKMSRFALDEGWYHSGSAQLVVTRGLGATGLPLRVNCAPEAVFIRLRRNGS